MSEHGAPVLLVHGGAGHIPDDLVEAYVAGIRTALDAGWAMLAQGRSAVDAVEAAIVSMEDDGSFDAGRGSVLNQDGRVQLDAMIMDGASLAAGAVGAVETARNPIRLARLVMDASPQVYLVATGAERFAAAHGLTPVDNATLVSPRERRRFEAARDLAGVDPPAAPVHDTVGAVALDAMGNLASGTSTGGTTYKPVGRIGDSSIVGAGGYADNESAAVSLTGEGEAIMRLSWGSGPVDRVAAGDAPQAAADAAIERLGARLGAHGGLIVLDRLGRIGVASNAFRMAWGIRSATQSAAEMAGPDVGRG